MRPYLLFLAAITEAQIWGTYKPNLYFSLKDISDAAKPQHLAIVWVVEDWRTGIPLVRHKVQELNYEKVYAFYDSHDGHDNAQETILDPDYNTEFKIYWKQQGVEWSLYIEMNPINKERQARATPFLYFWKHASLDYSPYVVQNNENGFQIRRQRSEDTFEGFLLSNF